MVDQGRHIAIVGPTASGKSAVAMALARRRNAAGLPTELVSCDSMQVYRHMDIGTAKPTAADQAEVRHHMIDLVEPTEDHDLPRFLESARAALAEIDSRGASAVLVGGTGLYVRAMVDDFTPPPHFPQLTSELEAVADTGALVERLGELDPVALTRIPDGNRRRLIRALEVTLGTGRPFSEHGTPLDEYTATRFAMFGLRPDRESLTRAIDARLEAQMDAGFLAEVCQLAGLDAGLSRTASQALGYRELFEHLRGACGIEEALTTAKVRTRRFAVRQLRWFGRDPRIEWFGAPVDHHGCVQLAMEIDRSWRKVAEVPGVDGTTVGGAPEPTPPHRAVSGADRAMSQAPPAGPSAEPLRSERR